MRTLIVAVVLAIAQASGPAPRAATHVKNAHSENRNSAAKPNEPPTPAVIPANPQQSTNSAGDTQADTSHKEDKSVLVTVAPVDVNKDRWDKVYIIASIIIVVATLVLAVTAWIQTSTARNTAEAARLSAQAVIDSQRAWVMATPAILTPPLKFVREYGDGIKMMDEGVINQFYVFFRNCGPTPAKILQTCASYIMIDSLSELPPVPRYPEVPRRTGIFLFNRKDESGKDEKIGQLARLGPTLHEKDVEAIRGRKKFLYGYGFVSYEDAFGKPHTTKFGYVYNFPTPDEPPMNGFLPAGPPSYNEAS